MAISKSGLKHELQKFEALKNLFLHSQTLGELQNPLDPQTEELSMLIPLHVHLLQFNPTYPGLQKQKS